MPLPSDRLGASRGARLDGQKGYAPPQRGSPRERPGGKREGPLQRKRSSGKMENAIRRKNAAQRAKARANQILPALAEEGFLPNWARQGHDVELRFPQRFRNLHFMDREGAGCCLFDYFKHSGPLPKPGRCHFDCLTHPGPRRRPRRCRTACRGCRSCR